MCNSTWHRFPWLVSFCGTESNQFGALEGEGDDWKDIREGIEETSVGKRPGVVPDKLVSNEPSARAVIRR
jgi:hypothetical protein